MDARCVTVGPLQENCWIVRREDSGRALVIDPGEEADRLITAIENLTVDAILLTHTHFDHVGAVAALARHTNAPVRTSTRTSSRASARSSLTTRRRPSRAAST